MSSFRPVLFVTMALWAAVCAMALDANSDEDVLARPESMDLPMTQRLAILISLDKPIDRLAFQRAAKVLFPPGERAVTALAELSQRIAIARLDPAERLTIELKKGELTVALERRRDSKFTSRATLTLVLDKDDVINATLSGFTVYGK